MSSTSIKLISWNVNGIRAVEKKGFIDYVQNSNIDIFAIQETKAHKEQLSDKLINIPGYKSFWHSAEKKGYSSVAFYTKEEPINIFNGIDNELYDSEGRVIIAEYANFYLLNCYFPNSQRELKRIDYRLNFSKALIEKLNQLQDKTRIICGDYNVAHKAIDLKNPKANEKNPGYSIEERTWMDKFLEKDYTDTFRMFNQDSEQYSWWSYRFSARTKNIGWRLDYFCIDSESKQRVKNAEIHQDILGSDHCPVFLELKI